MSAFHHEDEYLPVMSDRGFLIFRDRPTERITALAEQGNVDPFLVRAARFELAKLPALNR